jgi:hypothetical protein
MLYGHKAPRHEGSDAIRQLYTYRSVAIMQLGSSVCTVCVGWRVHGGSLHAFTYDGVRSARRFLLLQCCVF